MSLDFYSDNSFFNNEEKFLRKLMNWSFLFKYIHTYCIEFCRFNSFFYLYFRLLYKLGLNGRFLNKLWVYIQTNYSDQLQTRGLYQNSWSECHTVLSVCSNMFIFYTETLTDKGRLNNTYLDQFTRILQKIIIYNDNKVHWSKNWSNLKNQVFYF